jgi:hypothetical protein
LHIRYARFNNNNINLLQIHVAVMLRLFQFARIFAGWNRTEIPRRSPAGRRAFVAKLRTAQNCCLSPMAGPPRLAGSET